MAPMVTVSLVLSVRVHGHRVIGAQTGVDENAGLSRSPGHCRLDQFMGFWRLRTELLGGEILKPSNAPQRQGYRTNATALGQIPSA
jgi:hypothetical protein